MKVLFVCTGNICRSPMGELMFPLFFHDDSIVTDSAGIQGLINNSIDPSSERLMEQDGIDASAFRSKRLTPQIAMDSDLILCFTEFQRKKIVELAPRSRIRTFLLTDFADLCTYCRANNMIQGDTLEGRLDSVLMNASLVRPMLPPAHEIDDPYRKDFPAFETTHEQIGEAFASIAAALEPAKGVHAH
ncbi:low molecular weight phosphatase family protein [Bifidobacterium pseudolongum subsp. globosum]|uniref:arsenate reductase/protein-tyrosine-phosphatase family protein n=1 Tax=Bifidobacterium pseudolongum TaxID=1694 RepID=UPI000BA97D84|nr:low molecular weight phosphatase family protein [Bifidobacterium pseudolongum]ASW24141.1 low molecular weight phosphotyrosine phosphatase family protein [Bifidobacterium pseudolongum]MCI1194809.1 low molecular weight phosphatase family protein [Bifidobacterium pseudolongum subsp. globosum]UNP92816.1 low molecular weight phosphatase family protein [Bifidobacterium pseudolongum subsp. globosum]UNZ09423.1 low molecular weight phosphatase family protein [Bifidobacterium pseudolongum subsp. globo